MLPISDRIHSCIIWARCGVGRGGRNIQRPIRWQTRCVLKSNANIKSETLGLYLGTQNIKGAIFRSKPWLRNQYIAAEMGVPIDATYQGID